MKILYRQVFLKDLKKLKNQPIYDKVFTLAFTTLPQAKTLTEITQISLIRGVPNRYRIRLGDYRVGIEVHEDTSDESFTDISHRFCEVAE